MHTQHNYNQVQTLFKYLKDIIIIDAKKLGKLKIPVE